MNPYINDYVNQGIKIFACLPTKSPATPHGFYDASDDLEILNQQFESDDYLIGMPTGNVNGIVVVDIDPYKDTRGIDELIETLEELGPLPETFQVETLSGGRHLYFSIKNTHLSTNSWFFNKTLPIDIRANGGYACVPDGKNYFVYDDVDGLDIKNFRDRCAPLPEWIENFKKPTTEENAIQNILPESEIREIRSALNYIDADDRDTWIRVGLALKSTGSPTAEGLWSEYSQKSEKYNPQDQAYRWKTLKSREDLTIASLFYEAKKAGWVTTYERKDVSTIIPPVEIKESGKTQKYKFPEELLSPGGLVGDITAYIVENSIKPQPIFALAGALCAVGALAGRKYQTETGLRTNLYVLCVGGPGCGKEAPREKIKKIFATAGCSEYARVEDIASDTSIITALEKQPSQIFLLDEIGRFLKTTLNASRQSYLYNVVSVLLKLFSSTNQTVRGKIYADTTNEKEVIQPNLCLYGTTVPGTLYDGLSIEHITDGFLSRMLIFETDTPRPRKKERRNLTGPPPVEIIDQIKALKKIPINENPKGNLDDINPNPRIVYLTKKAVDILEEFDDDIEDLRDQLDSENKIECTYSRTVQLSEQIALIIAVGRNIDNPIIDEDCITYGISLAKHLSDRMLYIVNNYISENDYQHEVQKIYNMIKNFGTIKKSDLTRKTQNINSNMRNDILFTLTESNQIMEWIDGQTNTRYISII